MDTPQKSITQIGTPFSKSKFEDSPVFNYINSLSPIRPVKSIPIPNPFSSLNFTSPPSVFTSPHLSSFPKESRFFNTQNSSSNPMESHDQSHDQSTSNEEVAVAVAEPDATKDFNIYPSMEEEEEEEEPTQISKYDCGGTDLSLVSYAPPEENDSSEDAGMELQKMYETFQKKNETPDWESLISDTSELLIFGSSNESDSFRCLMMQKASNNEPESSHAAVSILHRGIRRRCLDFEMSGNKQTLNEHNTAAYESSSRCVVPSFGLHLNAIVMSSKGSGKIQMGLHISALQYTLDQTETETREDADQDVPVEPAMEEMNLNSPKKKRLKLEGGEDESCKRCNCKKSKCLKLYCECFSAGVYCIEPCSCVDCFNKPIHEDTILATRKQIESRNPLAFAPKVIRSSDSDDDSSKTPASARHKHGCNCKKSNCLKKYCECYQGGVGCSINCRCEGCKNAFGRKDGSSIVAMEAEQEEEDENSEKTRTVKTQQNIKVLMRKEESSALPTTLMSIYRQQLVQPLKNKMSPPQSLLGSSSNNQSSLTQSWIETITGTEEMSEILIHYPVATIKSVSPNSKRVSSRHLESSSSGSNGGRKLILQSIPSFPSLALRQKLFESWSK